MVVFAQCTKSVNQETAYIALEWFVSMDAGRTPNILQVPVQNIQMGVLSVIADIGNTS